MFRELICVGLRASVEERLLSPTKRPSDLITTHIAGDRSFVKSRTKRNAIRLNL